MQEERYGEQTTPKVDRPNWYINNEIHELAFLNTMRARHHFRCVNGRFYTEQEEVYEDEEMQQDIIHELSRVYSKDLYKRSCNLLELMRINWRYTVYLQPVNILNVANGTLDMMTGELKEKEFSLNRLPVAYDRDAPVPSYFLGFLDDLLSEEDQKTLQEYLGYCLIPCTKAQKMLMLVGRGGEGKSTLGRVISKLLGDQAMMTSIQKVCTNRFARADLEFKLMVIDDDMSLDALPETSYLKTLITLEGKTDLEKKGKQSYQGHLYARFLGFSNGSLSALYDRSDGFYRRQLILSCKERAKDRIDYVYLADQIIRDELPGVLNWCLEGLRRLLSNEFQFTVSEQTKRNLDDARRDANSAMEFLESEGYIHYTKSGCASTKALCEAYRKFCEDNSLKPISDRSFQQYIKQNQKRLGISYTPCIPTEKHKTVRGYTGIQVEHAPYALRVLN